LLLVPTDQGPDWQYLRAAQIDFAQGAFSEQAGAVQLPSNGLGFVTTQGFASITDGYLPEHEVNWVSIAGTSPSLGALTSTDVPGQLLAVAAREGQLALSVQTPEGGLVQLYDTTASTLTLTGSIEVAPGNDLGFIPGLDKLALSGAGGPAVVVDISVPNALIAQPLSSNAQRLIPTDYGLLGLDSDENGATGLGLSLWDVTATPAQTASLATDWPMYAFADAGMNSWALAGDSLAVPFHRQGDRYATLGVVTLASAALTLSGESHTRGQALVPLLTEGVAYAINEEYLEVVELDDTAPAVADPDGIRIDLRKPVTIHRAQNDRYDMALQVRPDTHRQVVFTPRAGGDPITVELAHHADELIVVGDQVVVAGLRWNSECQYQDPANGIPVDGNPSVCGPHNDRALSVYSTAGTPQLVQTFPISADMDWSTPIADTHVDTTWEGYLPLGGGQFVFLVDRMVQCYSYASCDELGVPAYVSMGSPGGMSCANPDECETQPPPGPIELVNGHLQQSLYYLLDLSQDEPALREPVFGDGPVETIGEGPLNLTPRAFLNGDEFAFRGTEWLYNEQGNSLTDTNGDALQRFMLHRFRFDAQGDLEALPAVNTPGTVMAYYGDHVWSAEPIRQNAETRLARLHESVVANDGAFIKQSIDLGTGYPDALQVADRLFVVLGPEDYCAETLESDLLEVDLAAQTLASRSLTTLPGGNWSFDWSQPTAADGLLQLRGGPSQYYGRLTLDVSTSGTASVQHYESVNPQLPPQF
jgi:hypothetical protein